MEPNKQKVDERQNLSDEQKKGLSGGRIPKSKQVPKGSAELIKFLRGKGFSVNSRTGAQDLAKARTVFQRSGAKKGARKFNRFVSRQSGGANDPERFDAKTDAGTGKDSPDNAPDTKSSGSTSNSKQSKNSKSGQQRINKPDLGLGDIDISEINSKKLADLITKRQFKSQFRELDDQIEDETAQGESNIDQIGDFFDEAQVIRKRAATRSDQSTKEALTEQSQTANAQISGAQSGQEAAIQRQVSAVQSQFSGAASLKGLDNENFFNRLQGDLGQSESKAKLSQQRVTGQTLRDLRSDRQDLQSERAAARIENFQTAENLKLGRLAAVQNLQIGAALAPGQVALQDEQLRQGKQQRNQVRAEAKLRKQENKQLQAQNEQGREALAASIAGQVLQNEKLRTEIDAFNEARSQGTEANLTDLDPSSRDAVVAGGAEALVGPDGNPSRPPKQGADFINKYLAGLGFSSSDPGYEVIATSIATRLYPGVTWRFKDEGISVLNDSNLGLVHQE